MNRASRAVVICRRGPSDASEYAMTSIPGNVRLHIVSRLGDALRLCYQGRVDHLLVNMFAFTDQELTALSVFRQDRPSQHVIVFCDADAADFFTGTGLADECRLARPPAGPARKAAPAAV